MKKYKNIVNINNRIFNFKNTDSVSICLNALFKKEGYNITIHELRYTYTTKLISHGLDFKTAAGLLGHTVEQTILMKIIYGGRYGRKNKKYTNYQRRNTTKS